MVIVIAQSWQIQTFNNLFKFSSFQRACLWECILFRGPYGLSYNGIRNCDFDLRKNKKLGVLISSSSSGGRGLHSPSDTDTHTHTYTHTWKHAWKLPNSSVMDPPTDRPKQWKEGFTEEENIFIQSFFQIHFWGAFLGATKHLYNWLCLSVGWSVG